MSKKNQDELVALFVLNEFLKSINWHYILLNQ